MTIIEFLEARADELEDSHNDPDGQLIKMAAAIRAIAESWSPSYGDDGIPVGGDGAEMWWHAVCQLALIFDDHPDYQDWKCWA